MQHPVAVRTNESNVFNLGALSPPQTSNGPLMVCFNKLLSQLSIPFGEAERTNLTWQILLTLPRALLSDPHHSSIAFVDSVKFFLSPALWETFLIREILGRPILFRRPFGRASFEGYAR